jgi:hypothetical protein
MENADGEDFITQEKIDLEVKALVNRAKAGCVNLRGRVANNEEIIVTNSRSYSSRLSEIISDKKLDDSIAKHTSAITRQSFYNFKTELSVLVKEIKEKKQ